VFITVSVIPIITSTADTIFLVFCSLSLWKMKAMRTFNRTEEAAKGTIVVTGPSWNALREQKIDRPQAMPVYR